MSDDFLGLVMVGRLGNHLGSLAAALSYSWDHDLPLKCPQLGGFPTPVQVDEMLEPLKKDFMPETFFWPGMCNQYFPVYERLLATYPSIADRIPENRVSIYQVHMAHNFREYQIQPNMVFVGYFFNERFFVHHREKIKALFQPTEGVAAYLRHKYGAIISDPKSVGVQFRDYTNDGDQWVENLSRQHYREAIEHFDNTHHFYIFTHAKAVAAEFFNDVFAGTQKRFTLIQHEQDFIDFYFLASLRNLIISNSSFGWWAAYLSPHEGKVVIAPRKKKWLLPKYNADDITIMPETENWRDI